MRVLVYVEGISDKLSMENLLRPLIDEKSQNGISIEFFEAGTGDRKETLLKKIPRKAVCIIKNNQNATVIIMPDLHPKNKGFPHATFEEMQNGIQENFEKALKEKRVNDDRLGTRFKVFCFKHDLEALILAAGDSLQKRVGTALKPDWKIPVEDQNHGHPPKRIVENLFKRNGRKYTETIDAPMILGQCAYQDIADKCPQCFKPFVEFLSKLQKT